VTRAVPIVALATVLALAGCGEKRHSSSSSGTSSADSISETEFKLSPASASVAPGSVIQVKNDGATTHALEIELPKGEIKTRSLKPGDSVQVKAPDKAGTYEMYCPIDHHKQNGMKGELTVGGNGGGASTDSSGGGGGGGGSSPGGY
jgi:plastocyanin